MAGQRLTDKTALATNPSKNDLLMVVDVSDATSKSNLVGYNIATQYVEVDNATFLDLDNNGEVLVPNAGANTVIIPLSVYMEYTPGGTPNTAIVFPVIGYADGDATYYWDTTKSYLSNSDVVRIWTGSNPPPTTSAASLSDKSLLLYFGNPADGASTGTIKVWTTWRLIDIS